MKNLSIILALFIAVINSYGNDQNKLKRYEIKSGIVEYVTTISGKVMGSTVVGNGTENLFFKDWGAVELKEERLSQTTTMKFFGRGKTETSNTHGINKLDNGESYIVDFKNKQIIASRDLAMDMITAFEPKADAGAVGVNMLESAGGEKTGVEKIMGYNCDVWEFSGGKQWLYKGVMLKIEMTVLGIKTSTQAKSAKFNVIVADKHFKLPDFPIQKEESLWDDEEYEGDMEDINDSLEELSKMSFEEWKKISTTDDEEMQEMSDEELRAIYDMLQKMIKMKLGK